MPTANPSIAWGVRLQSATYSIKVDFNSSGSPETLTFPSTGSLDPTTDYFMCGDGAADDLITMLAATLNTHTSLSTATVALNASHKIVVYPDAGLSTVEILWADAGTSLSGHVFGWPASTGSSTPITATNQPYGIWLPGRPPSVDTRDRQPIVGGINESVSGKVRVTRIALPNKRRDLGWAYIEQARALAEYTGTAGSQAALEFAAVESIQRGHSLRYYDDATAMDTEVYNTYLPRDLEDPLQRSEEFPTRFDAELRLSLTSTTGASSTGATPGGVI